jgi:RNA polymerase sigma factor (sigma-70 family)
MFRRTSAGVKRQIAVLWTTGTMTGLSDAQLLGRFTQQQDATAELAFTELVNRHGPMVWAVCRQLLPRSHDADDAFQATFLVLVRKAHSIRVGDSLAPWLYGVAYRTARRARAAATRYRSMVEEQLPDVEAPSDDAYMLDLRPMLYEELGRLPGKYRGPIVLCHLEGRTHEEAARLLSCPVGTVSGRLSRGRKLLRSRLERRGVTVSSVVLSGPWLTGSPSVVSSPLVESTLKVATQLTAAKLASSSVLSLAQGVLRTMFLRKLATISAAVLLAGALAGGAAWAHRTPSPTGHASQRGEPASASMRNTESAPNSKPSPAPQAKPQSTTRSRAVLVDCDPADCPDQADCDRTVCPIAMAANALTRMFHQFHDRPAPSR